MSKINPWTSLRQGEVEPGLGLIRRNYEHDPTPSHIMELGVAFLWLEDYKAAAEHFEQAIKKDRFTSSIYFGMAGAAYWCVEQPGVALRTWNSGIDAHFTDGGGGVHLPLLMLVASILRLRAFTGEAESMLKERIEDPQRKGWLKNWPGPLAKFALGLIDEKALLESCLTKQEPQTLHRRWLADFYIGMINYGRGRLNEAGLREVMRKTANTSAAERSDERDFLSLLWNEEFFIARHEASLDVVEWSMLLQGTAPPPWERRTGG